MCSSSEAAVKLICRHTLKKVSMRKSSMGRPSSSMIPYIITEIYLYININNFIFWKSRIIMHLNNKRDQNQRKVE